MWILDLLAGFFGAGVPSAGSPFDKNLTPEQNVTSGVGTVALPILGFILVLFVGLWEHPMISLVLLPGAFVLFTSALSARLGNEASWTFKVALLTAFSSLIASGVALLIGGLVGFYREF
jgi:hypothetical protein